MRWAERTFELQQHPAWTKKATVLATRVIWPVPPNGTNGAYTFRGDQDYGDRSAYGLRFHNGLDFSRPARTSIRAIASGVVVEKQVDSYKNTELGNFIRVQHAGYESRYCHMAVGSHNHLVVGASIAQGEHVGGVGDTGSYSFGDHLHLDIYISRYERTDPQAFIRARLNLPAEDQPEPDPEPEPEISEFMMAAVTVIRWSSPGSTPPIDRLYAIGVNYVWRFDTAAKASAVAVALGQKTVPALDTTAFTAFCNAHGFGPDQLPSQPGLRVDRILNAINALS